MHMDRWAQGVCRRLPRGQKSSEDPMVLRINTPASHRKHAEAMSTKKMWLMILFCLAGSFSIGMSEKICRYHDLIEHVNLTKHQELLSLSIPKKDWREPLTVYVAAKLIAILSVAEKTQSITSCIWFSVMWKNEFVSWNPEEMCNISFITFPLSRFWLPDLSIFEQVMEETDSWMPYANVTFEGMVTAAKPAKITTTCALDVYYFPFDLQNCNITIHSFMHHDKNIILKSSTNASQMKKETLRYFLDLGEWEFQDIQVEQGSIDGHSQLIYSIYMKRQPTLYILCLILPTCCLLILDILSYFMPNAYLEKVNFKVTVLLGVSVLSLILNDIIPISSKEAPVIVLFFIGTLSLMVMGILEIFFLLHIGNIVHSRGHREHRSSLLCKGQFKSNSENEPANEELMTADGVWGLLSKIQSDTELVREQIQDRKKEEQMEREKAALLSSLEKVFYYIHLVFVVSSFITFILKWSL
uniref:5-hydroxytryptamine receptor 3A-like n=2 Tax=Leptobrachium leishanense TaxID=445787 RepID=A0A8C5R6A6_9ANUR